MEEAENEQVLKPLLEFLEMGLHSTDGSSSILMSDWTRVEDQNVLAWMHSRAPIGSPGPQFLGGMQQPGPQYPGGMPFPMGGYMGYYPHPSFGGGFFGPGGGFNTHMANFPGGGNHGGQTPAER
mmetsp:Transcript_17313/g.29850  ORF Transcript_17313/g.29850 Transcript_17313/m.29850 type:complete len:124 (+) Transcript_17313:945-1316(+)